MGALYRFFPDKQAIFDAVAVRHMEEVPPGGWRGCWCDRRCGPGPALLERMVDAYIAYLDEASRFPRPRALSGRISALARESPDAAPGCVPAGLLREFMKRKLRRCGTRPRFDLRLRMAMETGERMIAYAYQREPEELAPDPRPELKRDAGPRICSTERRRLQRSIFSIGPTKAGAAMPASATRFTYGLRPAP